MSEEEGEEEIQYLCDGCGFSWCECCSECTLPHRDCEGCDYPECYVCEERMLNDNRK